MKIDEAAIRKAILALHRHEPTLANAIWDLLDAHNAARTELDITTKPKPATFRNALHDPDSGVINLGPRRTTDQSSLSDMIGHTGYRAVRRPDGSNYTLSGALPGSRLVADPNLGQVGGQPHGDTTVYVLIDMLTKRYHRLFGATKSCGWRGQTSEDHQIKPLGWAILLEDGGPCPRCWGRSREPQPDAAIEDAPPRGSDDTGTVWLTGDIYHRASSYVQDYQRRVCLLGVTQLERATGEGARAAGATPCPECYRNWPGTDGKIDCFACVTGPCLTHDCPECRGSGETLEEDPSPCLTCRGTGDKTGPETDAINPASYCAQCGIKHIPGPCPCGNCGQVDEDPDHTCESPDRRP